MSLLRAMSSHDRVGRGKTVAIVILSIAVPVAAIGSLLWGNAIGRTNGYVEGIVDGTTLTEERVQEVEEATAEHCMYIIDALVENRQDLREMFDRQLQWSQDVVAAFNAGSQYDLALALQDGGALGKDLGGNDQMFSAAQSSRCD